MGKCNVCGKKILYNKYKMYRGKVLCPECYDTRLERKAAKRAEAKARAEEVKIVTPTKKARKAAKKEGIKLEGNFIPDDADGHALDMRDVEKNEEKTAEDFN